MPSLTIREFEDGILTCINDNTFLLSTAEVWLNPDGVPAVGGDFTALRFRNINRNQAGDYVCLFTADGQTASATVPVVVECESLVVVIVVVAVAVAVAAATML